jgi:hypothetical protein
MEINMASAVYQVTEEKVAAAFNEINDQVFGGILDLDDLDDIDIDFLDTEWGYCIEEDGEIVLGLTDEFPSQKDFKDTLCHEMTHLWQIMNGWKVNHGTAFMKIADHAKKFGYTL